MKKMSHLVRALALAALIASLLAACSGSGSKADLPSPDTNAPNTAEPPAPQDTDWPTQPINVIVSFGAGGDTDLLCRKLCEEISKDLGVAVVCTNVTGSSGTVAARQVKDSAADGYTVLWHQSSFLVASATGVADFDYNDMEIAGVAVEEVSDCLMVRKGAYASLNDFIAAAKANPGGLNYGTSLGGYSHMQALAVADAFGVEFNIADIGGGSETIAALLAGDIDFVITTSNYARTYVESGDCDVLCIVANERCDATPDWPAMSEFGQSCDITKIFGFYMPKGTDPAIVEKWSAAVERAVNSESYAPTCEQYAVKPAFCGGEDAVALHDEQYEVAKKYAALMMN
ncbi:MAG: tripartite tricarboxylate transporter substrate binding protein [Oscillibacter sp.]|jgi:tripartite-type tricarboxylate transporter receptor subunit TctC|nr:tripartite tricarboxylate transporter substrate binding protein [Oscillibacter sp.]